ncbi:MAG: hypothetical protein NXI24_00735 [bacterium]|nr:hypothetical protein [bacterium]
METVRTEFEFVLPRGLVDPESGNVFREGSMRLATAADEILPMRDPRVQQNPAYLTVILLSRVITRLGNLTNINPRVIEGLFATDFAYLQEMYNRVNQNGNNAVRTQCPGCGQQFDVEVEAASPGEE